MLSDASKCPPTLVLIAAPPNAELSSISSSMSDVLGGSREIEAKVDRIISYVQALGSQNSLQQLRLGSSGDSGERPQSITGRHGDMMTPGCVVSGWKQYCS